MNYKTPQVCGYGELDEEYNKELERYADLAKREKELGGLKNIEDVNIKDWLPALIVRHTEDCMTRMMKGEARWLTAYGEQNTSYQFDEYEACMYLYELVCKKGRRGGR